MGWVAVVTDSSSCLIKELLEKHHILSVPLILTIEGKSYRDDIDITLKELFQILKRSKEHPVSSAPSPGDFLEAYHRSPYLQRGY